MFQLEQFPWKKKISLLQWRKLNLPNEWNRRSAEVDFSWYYLSFFFSHSVGRGEYPRFLANSTNTILFNKPPSLPVYLTLLHCHLPNHYGFCNELMMSWSQRFNLTILLLIPKLSQRQLCQMPGQRTINFPAKAFLACMNPL